MQLRTLLDIELRVTAALGTKELRVEYTKNICLTLAQVKTLLSENEQYSLNQKNSRYPVTLSNYDWMWTGMTSFPKPYTFCFSTFILIYQFSFSRAFKLCSSSVVLSIHMLIERLFSCIEIVQQNRRVFNSVLEIENSFVISHFFICHKNALKNI